MARRHYANAAATTLTAPVAPADTTLQVASVTGLPVSYPFTLILDRETSSEEVVLVTAGSGTALTAIRGYDNTPAFSHATGAVVVHGISAMDADEANAHVNATSSVHGVAGALVGATDAQVLTNKTISIATNEIGGLLANNLTAADASGNLEGTSVPLNKVVTTDGAQALTNKDLSDPNNTFPSTQVDTTSAQTLTNKTLGSGTTLPSTVVTTTGAQSLSNKTITGGTIAGFSIRDTGVVGMTLAAGVTGSIGYRIWNGVVQIQIGVNASITSTFSALTSSALPAEAIPHMSTWTAGWDSGRATVWLYVENDGRVMAASAGANATNVNGHILFIGG